MSKNKKAEHNYQINEIMPDIYRLTNCGVHMELAVGSRRALLFDTGFGFSNLSQAVREITGLPLDIVNSHGHMDHSCGNHFFTETVYIHPDDMDLCRRHNAPAIRQASVEFAAKAEAMLSAAGRNGLPANFNLDDYLQADCGRLTPVRQGHIFDLGNMCLEVIELPGHTPGSIGLLCPERKLLLVGDAINANLFLFLPESTSLAEYCLTLNKAETLDFTYMLQSHNPVRVPKDNLRFYLSAAENLDYEKGKINEPSPLAPGVEIRTCSLPGKSPQDEDYAQILLSEDKLRTADNQAATSDNASGRVYKNS